MKKRIIVIGLVLLILSAAAIMLLWDSQIQQEHQGAGSMPVSFASDASNANLDALLKDMKAKGEMPELDRSTSLGGPDVDGNGIRDDIDRLIMGLKRNKEETQALQQFAKASQSGLVKNIRTREEAKVYMDDVGRGIGCIHHRFGKQGSLYRKLISLSIKNTHARMIEENRVGQLLSGGVFSTFGSAGCEH